MAPAGKKIDLPAGEPLAHSMSGRSAGLLALCAALGAPQPSRGLAPPPPPPPACAHESAEECLAANRGGRVACGFCGSSWSCLPGGADGPAAGAVGCAEGEWVSTLAQLKARRYAGKLYTPPGEWRLAPCEHGGAKHFAKPFPRGLKNAPLWGGQSCDCPPDYSGLTCAACATDAACAPGEHCAAQLASAGARLVCGVEASMPDNAVHNLLNDFAPDPLIRLTVHGSVATLDVIKPVEKPSASIDALRSPYIFRAYARSVTAASGLRCPLDAGAGGVAVPWPTDGSARCLSWELSGDIDIHCPPLNASFPSWSRFGDACPIMEKFFKPPVRVVCDEAAAMDAVDAVGGAVGGGGQRADRPHGCVAWAVEGQFSFRLSCKPEGGCVQGPEPAPSPPAPPLPEPSYCERHRSRCDHIKVSAVFAAPLLAAALALAVWQTCGARQRKGASHATARAREAEGAASGGAPLPLPMFAPTGSMECAQLEAAAGSCVRAPPGARLPRANAAYPSVLRQSRPLALSRSLLPPRAHRSRCASPTRATPRSALQ